MGSRTCTSEEEDLGCAAGYVWFERWILNPQGAPSRIYRSPELISTACVTCFVFQKSVFILISGTKHLLVSILSVIAHCGSTSRHTSHRFITMSDRPGLHNCREHISSKIRSLLISLTNHPSDYDQITPMIERWIEYAFRDCFATADELVEEVSYVAWEIGGSYASVGRFLKEFRGAPHRSEQARSFVTQLCPHILRWFAIASAENLPMNWSDAGIASGGGNGFIRAASFVGHLIECGLLSRELVRQHLIKPLIDHHGGTGGDHVRANAIYELFLAAGNGLFQGLFEAEDIRICFENLSVYGTGGSITGYDTARIQVRFITRTKASNLSITCGPGTL